MKKGITRSIAFITTLLMIVMITPFTLKDMIVSAASNPSNKISNITCTSTTLTWSGFDKYSLPTLSVSNSSMITNCSFNGNNSFIISISQNNSSSQRTGYVYAKKNGKTIATYTIIQKPHTHLWGNWTVTKDSGCTTSGSQCRTCSCGAKETKVIYPHGHSMKDIATKPATCTKGKTVTMRCKYCSYQFTTTVGSPMGHSMTYSYDAKTKKIIGKCSRGDVYDKNVTYEDYLYFEQSKDGKANREKYADLFLLNNPKIGKSVGQLRSEINKFNITEESYKTIMKELTGLPENYLPSLNPTNGSFVDVFTQLNAYQAVYQNFKAVDYYEWAQFGYSLLRILGGDGDVNDYMTTMGKLVSCVDKFNIMSTQLEVIQKEIGEMSKKVQEYRNKMFSYIAWDTPIEACDDKLVAEMTLKELVDYEYQIRASFSRLDGGPKANENAQAAYNYIVSLKKLYIYYLILNPEEMSFEEFRDLNDRVYEIYNDILKKLF